MTLEEKIKKLMGEFLDLSSIKATNLDHLEAIRQDLNILMGQFVEEWSDKRNPHIIPEYVDTSGEIGASEIEMVKTEIEEVIEMGDGKAEVLTNEEDAVMYTCSFPEDFELEERKANKEGEE
tara:strand:+ start:587 stop:952 length:366 start_codon:yes stop_codon:yes gene_type:complete